MSYKIMLLLFLPSFIYATAFSQKKTLQIKADSVKISSNCDTAELILENRTRAIPNGVLTNKGNGVTEFRRVMVKLNDSAYTIGGDTLSVSGLNKNIYNSNGSLTDNRIVDGNNKDLRFINNSSSLISNKAYPVVISRTPMDSAILSKIKNNLPASPFTGLIVRGTGCDATLELVSDSAGTCTELQFIEFKTLKPRKDSWLTNISPYEGDKYLLGKIQLETSKAVADYSVLKFSIKSDTIFFKDGTYVMYNPGKSGGYTPYPLMALNPSYKHPSWGVNTKMPYVQINGGLFVGYGRDWYFSPKANDVISGVDDVEGYLQPFYETRFSVYADSLPLKIYKLPTLKGSAFLTYSPDRTVEGNNVAFEYKDSIYNEIRNYISLNGLTTPSDIHLKENITTSQFDAGKLLGLSIRDFNYIADKSKTRYTGLLAQELKLQVPELVKGNEGNYSIDYIKMVPYLLKVLQDQQREIDRLKQQADNGPMKEILASVQQMQQQLLQQQAEMELLKERLKK